jgi:hypothetical protein
MQRKFREMDVSREQWEELQRLTKSGASVSSELDPPEAVEARVGTLLKRGMLSTLNVINAATDKLLTASKHAADSTQGWRWSAEAVSAPTCRLVLTCLVVCRDAASQHRTRPTMMHQDLQRARALRRRC